MKKIKTALLSVYNKKGLDKIVSQLNKLGVTIYSTGGTKDYIETLNVKVNSVESLTNYPSILGGRVKTLHPHVFGGILAQASKESDKQQLAEYNIPSIDLVLVDLYPFESTIETETDVKKIIEKIDIGGVSLIRAAAKNYHDVLIISSQTQYAHLDDLLNANNGHSSLSDRLSYSIEAFATTSHYDTTIFKHFSNGSITHFRESQNDLKPLRYGENPHQKAFFFGDFNRSFEQLNGKEISYNNLVDIDAACNLINDFEETTLAILKHNNACGIASCEDITQAWHKALAGDPISAFGGVISTNEEINKEAAEEINKLFFEIIIAPSYDEQALTLLKQKKNRIILLQKEKNTPKYHYRSLLKGTLVQEQDTKIETPQDLKLVTDRPLTNEEKEDLLFANKLVKHSKSNAIVLVKNKQMIASGIGQTSRVDALEQSIQKAKRFKFNLNGAVVASDAFFPFSDCVEIAGKAGIKAVIQPGGSKRDKDSINYCRTNNISMVLTGIRHFKH